MFIRHAVSIIVVALLTAACAGGKDPSQYRSIQCTPRNDSLIVPGERIGRVCLGMSLAELHRNMGEPVGLFGTSSGNVHFGAMPGNYAAGTGQITAHFGAEIVDQISVRVSDYATREGLRVGSSALAVRSAPGPPDTAADWRYCYRDRALLFHLDNGRVSMITTDLPPLDCRIPQ